MRTRLLHVIALLTLALAVFVPLPIAHIGETASSHHTNLSGAAPLLFVENVGQFDARARFQAYGSDSVLLATVADYSHGIAVDTSGAAYVALSVTSSDFPSTPGAFDRIYGVGTCGAPPNTYLCSDIAIAKLSPSGSALI